MPQALAQQTVSTPAALRARARWPPEAGILMVLVGLALAFELLGWIFVRQSFLLNEQRLVVMILQVSVIGIIAIGVTQVIITGGIDLSSGSVVALTAMVAASLAQSADAVRPVYPSLTDLPVIVPVVAGLAVGAAAGLVNGTLIARTSIPPFIATLGVMVSARGLAKWYTRGQPVSMLTRHLCRHRQRRGSGRHLPRHRAALPYRAALHALRQVHLCDRRQSAGGARVRNQRAATSDRGLHDRRHTLGTCRAS